MSWTRWRCTLCSLPCALTLACATWGCAADAGETVLDDAPLHLEEHLDAARVTGSELPSTPSAKTEWHFSSPETPWLPAPSLNSESRNADLSPTGEAMRIALTARTRGATGITAGGAYAAVPDWKRGDISDVIVRARSDNSISRLQLGFNLRSGQDPAVDVAFPFEQSVQSVPIVRDGTIHTYRLRVDAAPNQAERRIRELGLWVSSDGGPGSIDILSVTVLPQGEVYREERYGMRAVPLDRQMRRALFVHAPARVTYRVRIPPSGRLDVGLSVLRTDAPVTFRVLTQQGNVADTLLQEAYSDPAKWGQRSVDLSAFAGRAVTLSLEADAQPGTVAIWSAPTLSGARTTTRPNVIFYVIDGAAADLMSVYGYNRRTTPNLEVLARDGAVVENAYSTASWTKPSTTTFMTSLHSSVLGGLSDRLDRFQPIPAEALTMAERFHHAGYQTAVFTTNPWAGSFSNLERGVDVFRDRGAAAARSASVLHADFWDWRSAFPGEPYWVHFQTTGVHAPHNPQAPVAGLFAPPALRKQVDTWNTQLSRWEQQTRAREGADLPDLNAFRARQWRESGVDRVAYNDALRAIHDEAMAQQDHELGRFVDRLKQNGDWDRTILVIAADHSISAGSGDFVVALTNAPDSMMLCNLWCKLSPQVILRSTVSRVPLVIVWPGHIQGGQRFTQPVSMIDVLPTLLELTGQPLPEILQGQSLVPLLLGREGWRPRPVIFDDFARNARTGEMEGRIEMIDGRWGAALWMGTPEDTINGKQQQFYLYDVWADPLALQPMNEQYPDLVTKYTDLLLKQKQAHELLATRFTPGAKIELTPEQLETLRALGYIR